jgi:hypothetical protein
MRTRQQYISRSTRTGDEIRDIRNILDSSLSNIVQDPTLDPVLLEAERRKLDDSMDLHGVPTRLAPRRRSPVRNASPLRAGVGYTSTPAMQRRRATSPRSRRQNFT